MSDAFEMVDGQLRAVKSLEWGTYKELNEPHHEHQHPIGYERNPYWKWGVEWDLALEVFRGEGENTDSYVVSVVSADEPVSEIRCGDFPALLSTLSALEPALRISGAHVEHFKKTEHMKHLGEDRLDDLCSECMEFNRRARGMLR